MAKVKKDLSMPEVKEKELKPKVGMLENLDTDYYKLPSDMRACISKLKKITDEMEEDKIKL